jgi:hypothetical protein
MTSSTQLEMFQIFQKQIARSKIITNMAEMIDYISIKAKYPIIWSTLSQQWEKGIELYLTAVNEERRKNNLIEIPKFSFHQVNT